MTEANYDVFGAITELSLSNLKQNIGFYFFLGYWSVYLALLLTLLLLTRRITKSTFFVKLFRSLSSEQKLMKYIEDNKV